MEYQAEFVRFGETQYGPKAFFKKKDGSDYGLGFSQLPDKGQGFQPGERFTIRVENFEIQSYHPARVKEYPRNDEAPARPWESPAPQAAAPRAHRPDEACMTGLAKSLIESKAVENEAQLERWLSWWCEFTSRKLG